jgi:hypothetical protein
MAPRVRHVVAVEQDEEPAGAGPTPPNVEVVVGDGEHLALEPFVRRRTACIRVLHHTRRPELMVAELARMTGRAARSSSPTSSHRSIHLPQAS